MPSAVIASYNYDAPTETLEISYHSGKVYHYLNVPEKVFAAMHSTMVKGIWFNRNIKAKYPFKEVTPGLNQQTLFDHGVLASGLQELSKQPIMAKNENINNIDRKGKPAGSGRENETLNEAADEANDVQNLDTSELDVQHPNRHLHKGEDVKTFKDHEE